MIKFFRNIRQKLLQEGKTTNYLKYAIGEIILVVVGILIALQINNWNEERKDNIRENHLVKSLYDEFVDNYHYIDERKQLLLNSTEKSGLFLLKLCNENHTDLTTDSIFKIISGAFYAPGYSPKTSTFKRIINNEEFNLVQQDSLKALLNQYDAILELSILINTRLYRHSDELTSYANDKFGGLAFERTINDPIIMNLFKDITPIDENFDMKKVISDPVFESILSTHLRYYAWTINRLDELQDLNQTIRHFIDRHYKI